ncbi:MAG: hypothetical protein IH910_00030 [Proteobacteria bacterium]|nr:hypothetical protein [Pseudomonadota bacterium]
MKRIFSGALAGAMLLLISSPLTAQNDSVSTEELRQCREYSDLEKRLACYDQIGELAPVVETPAVPVAAELPAATAAAAVVLQEVERDAQHPVPSDDFGFPKSEDALESIRATVVRCGEANDHRFYFYLDNGQVWKYLGSKYLKYKSCDSPVTLSEDSLGFKLQMDGKSSLRVKRVR